jgi:hypothetical protein
VIVQAEQAGVDSFLAHFGEYKLAEEIVAEVARPANPQSKAVEGAHDVERPSSRNAHPGAKQVGAQARRFWQAGDDQVAKVGAKEQDIVAGIFTHKGKIVPLAEKRP